MDTMPTDDPFVGSDFTAEDFTAISSILSQAGGVDLDHYNAAYVKRRIAARIRELKLAGPQTYIDMLHADRAEAQRLNALLPLHVSSFYRDPSTFVALRKILQQRAEATPPRLPVRWWSAGCAGGGEAYSLALLAAQVPGFLPSVEILATDVSHEILEKGRSGLFSSAYLNNVPDEERGRSFATEGGDSFRIKEPFRSMVRFVRHDLLTDAYYPSSELILCRYVLMYFNSADHERIVGRFAEALPAGGILVLGRTETLRNQAELFTPINVAERIYRRI